MVTRRGKIAVVGREAAVIAARQFPHFGCGFCISGPVNFRLLDTSPAVPAFEYQAGLARFRMATNVH